MSNEDMKENKSPVFVVHPIEGNVDILRGLAKQIKAPVYGLQCTDTCPLSTINELAKHYVQQVKSVQKQGPYVIIGYSFGACVAFEMGIQLEAAGERVKLLLLDGSHAYVAMYTKNKKSDANAEQSEALVYFANQFKEVDQPKLISELVSLKTMDDRLERISRVLKGSLPYSDSDIKSAAASFYYKLVAADTYKPKTNFKGDITLVKAKDTYVLLNEDYGLNSVCKQKVNIELLEGNHRSILRGPTVEKIANILHSIAA